MTNVKENVIAPHSVNSVFVEPGPRSALTIMNQRLQMLCFTILPRLLSIAPYVGLSVSYERSLSGPILAMIFLSIGIVPSCVALFQSLGDINEIVTIMASINAYIVAFGCVALTVLKRRGFIQLIKEVMSDLEAEISVASEASRRQLVDASGYVFLQFFFCGSALFIFAVSPFVGSVRTLPFPASFPFETDYLLGFCIVYFIQIGGGTIVTLVFGITLCCLLSIMGHTCLHLENLSNALRSRLETSHCLCGDEVTMDPEAEKSLQEFLIKCIDRHVHLLRRIRLIDETFSNFFLFGLLGYVAFVSTSTLEFLTITSGKITWRNVKYGTVAFTGFFLLYPACNWGSRIISAQIDVSPAIYTTNYHLFSESIQRTLNIISVRANGPIQLTTAGIGKLDVQGCGQAIGLTYAIFTLLLRFKTEIMETQIEDSP